MEVVVRINSDSLDMSAIFAASSEQKLVVNNVPVDSAPDTQEHKQIVHTARVKRVVSESTQVCDAATSTPLPGCRVGRSNEQVRAGQRQHSQSTEC